jgi:hypothetical protein
VVVWSLAENITDANRFILMLRHRSRFVSNIFTFLRGSVCTTSVRKLSHVTRLIKAGVAQARCDYQHRERVRGRKASMDFTVPLALDINDSMCNLDVNNTVWLDGIGNSNSTNGSLGGWLK